MVPLVLRQLCNQILHRPTQQLRMAARSQREDLLSLAADFLHEGAPNAWEEEG